MVQKQLIADARTALDRLGPAIKTFETLVPNNRIKLGLCETQHEAAEILNSMFESTQHLQQMCDESKARHDVSRLLGKDHASFLLLGCPDDLNVLTQHVFFQLGGVELELQLEQPFRQRVEAPKASRERWA